MTVVAISSLLVIAGTAAATPTLNVQKCLESTTTHSLDASGILDGIGLDRDTKKEISARLSQYNNANTYKGLDGLGLTAEQKTEIQRRIDVQVAAMHKHPVGWPCSPFKHPQSVVTFLRKQLVYNGFRPAMTLRLASPRQVQFAAIQDGIQYWGTAAKTGARQITVLLTSTSRGVGGSYRLAVPFDP